MSSKFPLFSFGSINKRLMYPILTGVSHLIIRIGNRIISSQEPKEDHPVIQNFFMFVGEFLAIFLFLIERKLSKCKTYKDKNKKNWISYLRITGYIFLCCFIDYVASFALKLVRQGGKGTAFLELVFKLLVIGLTAILAQCMLKTKYYLHHYIGLVILLFGVGAYGFLSAYTSFDVKAIKFEYCWFLLIYLICAFLGIIEKYLMEIEYVNAYLIVAGEGFYGIILSGFSFAILNEHYPNFIYPTERDEKGNLIKLNKDYLEGFQYYLNTKPLIGIIIYIIGVTFFNAFKMKTNQAYSPTHRAIGDNLSGMIFFIVQICLGDLEDNILIIVLEGISYIIISIGILIFLELIIMHFCGMDNNTRDSINERLDEEKEELSLNEFNSNEEEDEKDD